MIKYPYQGSIKGLQNEKSGASVAPRQEGAVYMILLQVQSSPFDERPLYLAFTPFNQNLPRYW
jgi:hypothetical protein